MSAVDTNILVYSHRKDSTFNEKAFNFISRLSKERWQIPWPCIYEFYAIVTHPKIYKHPSTPAEALEQIKAWLESPHLVLLSELDNTLEILEETCKNAVLLGAMIHDAKVAVLLKQYEIKTLYSADRDFSRFKGFSVVNPLI